MNEQEWLSSPDPLRMLGMHAGPGYRTWLRPSHLEGVSDRKLRLFACAVSRGHPKSDTMKAFGEEHERKASFACGVAERWADGEITAEYAKTLEPHCWTVMSVAVCEAARLMAGEPRRTAITAGILRDLIGNPFRAVVLSPEWMTPMTRLIAQAAYDSGKAGDGTLDPAICRVLSDALEEEGCPAEERPPLARDVAGLLLDKTGNYTVARCPMHPKFDGSYNPAGHQDHRVGTDYTVRFNYGYDGVYCDVCRRVYNNTPSQMEMARLVRPHPLLAHLRSAAPHYRGMWSLDLVLGKEQTP
jgi:hypothetical protein